MKALPFAARTETITIQDEIFDARLNASKEIAPAQKRSEKFAHIEPIMIYVPSDEDKRLNYLQQIAKLKLENLVELRTSFIPDSEVRNYFGIADLVAQPYRTATQSGVSQIAYHFEKPMLVTNVGGLAEIVPHGKVGYVVDVETRQIADALVDFYQNQRADAFIGNIKTEKLKYEWSKMTSAICNLII